MGPPHFAEARRDSNGFLFPLMLFTRNALAFEPQACFLAEKRLAKVKVHKGRTPLPKPTRNRAIVSHREGSAGKGQGPPPQDEQMKTGAQK